MPQLVVTASARADIASILATSERSFGVAARRRYEALLKQALDDLAEDPDRAGVVFRADLRKNIRTYRLFFSRRRTSPNAGFVKHPRHAVAFQVRSDGAVEIVRILHEHMDFDLHLPREENP